MNKKYITLLVSIIFTCVLFSSMTIQEKRKILEKKEHSESTTLSSLNEQIQNARKSIVQLQETSTLLYEELKSQNVSEETLENFAKERKAEIDAKKQELQSYLLEWKKLEDKKPQEDFENIFREGEITVGQFVAELGSHEYVYIVPQEIAAIRIFVSTQMSIPKAQANEMLELVLAQYGIGVKKLSPILCQLFFLRINQAGLSLITDDAKQVELLSDKTRLCFILQPPATETKRIFQFLEKFAPLEQMSVQIIGNHLALVGFAKDIKEVLKIYSFIAKPKQQQDYRLVVLQKAQSEEMARILQSMFEGDSGKNFMEAASEEKSMPFFSQQESSFGFRVITLKHPAQSLFLMGKHDQLEKAVHIIQDVENKIGEVKEKTLHWYACRYSEADELAEVLSLVYNKMITAPDAFSIRDRRAYERNRQGRIEQAQQNIRPTQDTSSSAGLIVSSSKISPSDQSKKKSYAHHENFIVDNKTNSIVMVVEAYLLPKLKELLKKLDVPKKMVQIDVLLFEKRISDTNNFGLNLLRLGKAAEQKHFTKVLWNTTEKNKKSSDATGNTNGLFSFLLSRGKHSGFPAFDIAFNFLLSQEDIQINANPSVTTVNQTPAKIAVVEQISINTGVLEVDTTNTTRLKDSFSREEYGITIQITPTIHAKIDDEQTQDSTKYITLVTDIIFDTTRPSADNRPEVTRRNIKNEVRIADGQTVILGGLRRKFSSESQQKVPFLGEIPGLGKLFSTTDMGQQNSEMFIFLTPRIIPDEKEEYKQMIRKELNRRPGDLPELINEVKRAEEAERIRIFSQGLKALFQHNKAPIR